MPKNKFQQMREETYTRLLQAGIELFCEKGYSSTSLEDITTRAGYTKGAFYVHFKSKEAFFFQLLDYRSNLRGDWPDGSESGNEFGHDLQSAVEQRIRIFLDYLNQSPEWLMVYIDFYLQAQKDERIRTRYQAYYKQWITESGKFIDDLKNKGWIAHDKDTVKIAKRFYELLDGNIIHKNLYGEPIDPEEITETMIAILK